MQVAVGGLHKLFPLVCEPERADRRAAAVATLHFTLHFLPSLDKSGHRGASLACIMGLFDCRNLRPGVAPTRLFGIVPAVKLRCGQGSPCQWDRVWGLFGQKA
jgi:hypothetical protein